MEHESQASYCVEEWNSACLWSSSPGDRPLVKFYLKPAPFSGQCNGDAFAPGMFSLHSSWEGEHGIAPKSWQGNPASRCFEGGISSSFCSCFRKLWLPSTCDSDLKEPLRVFMGSQEYGGVVGASLDSTGSVQRKRASSRVEAGKRGSS